MPKTERMNISISGQDFVLQVDPGEREDTLAAAQLVEQRMKEMASLGAMGTHKQAIMTAFNLAFEWLRLSRDPLVQPQARADIDRRLDSMAQTIDKALGPKP